MSRWARTLLVFGVKNFINLWELNKKLLVIWEWTVGCVLTAEGFDFLLGPGVSISVDRIGEVFGGYYTLATLIDELEGKPTMELLISGKLNSELLDLVLIKGYFFLEEDNEC